MPIIELETKINSKIEICFDLSRSIDLHKISIAKSNEKAINGKISGLIGLDEFVTWKATHFGIIQKLTSKITKYKRPFHFKDEQTKGIFKLMKHDHYFEVENNIVIMKDIFEFKSPFGIFGKLFNYLILTKYLKNLLVVRNETIRDFAETEKWKTILNE